MYSTSMVTSVFISFNFRCSTSGSLTNSPLIKKSNSTSIHWAPWASAKPKNLTILNSWDIVKLDIPLSRLLTSTLSDSAFIPEGIENGASGRAYL